MVEKYKCITCGNDIFFGDRDREFYIKQNYVDLNGEPIKPKRCKECRERMKQLRQKYS
jgi:hypothetical protein